MNELAATLILIVSASVEVALILLTVPSNIGAAGSEASVMARGIRSIVSEMTTVLQEMFTEILDFEDSVHKDNLESGLFERSSLRAPGSCFPPESMALRKGSVRNVSIATTFDDDVQRVAPYEILFLERAQRLIHF
ncbi:hypothetical protein GQ53DRAFT_827331 [Thozetella sp. PMI_491]|nr:hypothetical protein GQ53DRAFT_827331 [Thozetella sp. PMI_491]